MLEASFHDRLKQILLKKKKQLFPNIFLVFLSRIIWIVFLISLLYSWLLQYRNATEVFGVYICVCVLCVCLCGVCLHVYSGVDAHNKDRGGFWLFFVTLHSISRRLEPSWHPSSPSNSQESTCQFSRMIGVHGNAQHFTWVFMAMLSTLHR